MTGSFMDFNDAEPQFDVIPKGTLAKVRMKIRPGGFDDPTQGWVGGYATHSESTGSVYLDCEYVVTEGPFARRKIWSLIGLYSPKGPNWGNMGRSFIRSVLNSANGLSDKDTSARALEARRIQGFADLDGLEFVAKIDVEDGHNGDKNVIKQAITAQHKDYQKIMGGTVATTNMAQTPPQNTMAAPTFQPPQQQQSWQATPPPAATPQHQPTSQPPQFVPPQPQPAQSPPQQTTQPPQQESPAQPSNSALPGWAQ
ncbi:hypothetical protein ACQZV8_07505 [Magnetococcales bacterium HHB-1]